MRLTLQSGGPAMCEDRGSFEPEAAAGWQELRRYTVRLAGFSDQAP